MKNSKSNDLFDYIYELHSDFVNNLYHSLFMFNFLLFDNKAVNL